MSNIVVGISDLKLSNSPDILVTYALGSCVGICIYDPVLRIGGLSHIMLPSIKDMATTQPPNRFADSAIVSLVKQLQALGAKPTRLTAKIAGGAQMFAVVGNTTSPLANIGQRNVFAVKSVLGSLKIPILAEDTGSNFGRTVYFSLEDGSMTIKSASKGVWVK